MKRCISVILAAVAMAGFSNADEKGVTRILEQWSRSQEEWKAGYEYAAPDMKETMLKNRPNAEEIVKPLWKQLAPVLDKPEALPGVVWMMNHPGVIAKRFSPKECKDIVTKLLDSIEFYLISTPGIGKTAYALSASSDVRCRKILEKMRTVSPHIKDQGLAALALAGFVEERHGLLRDDPRLLKVKLQYIKEAIQKSFDEPYGNASVSDYCTEYMYEVNNLMKGRKAPKFQLTSSEGSRVDVPEGKPALLVFCLPNDQPSMALAGDAQVLKEKYKGLEVFPICPMDEKAAKDQLPLLNLPVPVLLDEKADVFKQYRIVSVPYVYFIDKSGVIRLRGEPDIVFDAALSEAFQAKPEGAKTAGPNAGFNRAPAPVPADKGGAPELKPIPE